MAGQQVYIVTGGNRGIGLETVRQLSAAGHHVILGSRSAEQGAQAAASVGGKVEAMALDLASLASVRAFADAFKAKGLPLHGLINNAGVYGVEGPRKTTVDGFEAHFGTNHLGHFLLTNLLLDTLVRSAPSRVVTLSSGLHDAVMGKPAATMDFDDLQMEQSYDGARAYAVSKLANILFTNELDRRFAEKRVTALAVSPGVVPSTVAGSVTGFNRFFMKYIMPMFPIARTPAQAAGNTVFAATDASLEGKGAQYIEDRKAKQSSQHARNVESAKRLWDVSAKLVGLA